jgi:hypothetical protein
LTLVACGRKGPPVAPETRAPSPVVHLAGAVHAAAIEIAWTPPDRRADNTVFRDPGATTRIFRVEDDGRGDPKAAMLVGDRIAGYAEVAALGARRPAPAVARGRQLVFTDREGLAYGRRYTYVVIVSDSQGRTGPAVARVSVTYVAAAEPPADLVADPGEREARLAWQAPTRLIDGSPPAAPLAYEVLRAASAEAELVPVTSAPIAERALIDRPLENDRAYHYAVRAVQTVSGTTVYSAPSPRVAVTPRDVTPPSAPANLTAIPSAGAVRLAWSPVPDSDVAVYVVYRATAAGAFERVGSTRPPIVTFVDRDVAGGAYRYVVTAQDSAARPNESARSNEVSVTVP